MVNHQPDHELQQTLDSVTFAVNSRSSAHASLSEPFFKIRKHVSSTFIFSAKFLYIIRLQKKFHLITDIFSFILMLLGIVLNIIMSTERMTYNES